MLEDFEAVKDRMSFAASLFASTINEVKFDGRLQASCLAAFISTLKETGFLNESVDMAVSLDGKVLRNEEAADHCE